MTAGARRIATIGPATTRRVHHIDLSDDGFRGRMPGSVFLAQLKPREDRLGRADKNVGLDNGNRRGCCNSFPVPGSAAALAVVFFTNQTGVGPYPRPSRTANGAVRPFAVRGTSLVRSNRCLKTVAADARPTSMEVPAFNNSQFCRFSTNCQTTFCNITYFLSIYSVSLNY